MKKAFTLIELLVVIAIIAILAAILFPVFAQAKMAAKKAVSLSNQKQIGLGLVMYSGDYDDYYPRNDGCTLNDSIIDKYNNQPPGTNPTPWCNGTGSGGVGDYAFRDNHYSWQKWIMPYVKNRQLFFHPVIAPIYGTTRVGNTYKDQGELESGYALNTAITGALNTWGYSGPPYTNVGAIRNSFLGGTQTNVPDPAQALLVMEQGFLALIGGYEYPGNGSTTTYYPMAIREHWQAMFYTQGGSGPCGETTTVDTSAVPFANNVPISYCDGHTKVLSVGQFLANSPTYTQYGLPWSSTWCGAYAAYYMSGTGVQPHWTQPWPMWGLQ
ncbi:MAG TPA: prepilin-type N-terminal cleavage/methylation domain-containing protein [Fimbriimonadaceae bacterium]|nr:prepilin-type N-terminal cleavage/methylation domain-containing protein [Fimbriimonadaceae bacterium]